MAAVDPVAPEPVQSWRDTHAWLREVWRPFHGRLGLLVVTTVVSAALRVAFPYLHQFLIDALRSGSDAGPLALIVIATGVVRSLVYGFLQFQRARQNYTLERAARERVFDRVLALGPEALAKHPVGDLLARLSDDCGDKVAWFACSGVFRLIEATVVIVLALVALTTISPLITLLAVAPLPLIAIVYRLTAGRLDRLYAAVQARVSALEAFLDSLFTGIEVVKAYGLGPAHAERFAGLARAHRDAEIAAARGQIGVEMLHGFGWQFSIVAFIVAGGAGVMHGTLTLGQFISFEEIVLTLAWPALDWGTFFVSLRRAGASVARLRELEAYAAEVPVRAGAAAPDLARGVALEGVLCRTPDGRVVLDGVSLEVPAGALVAVTGRLGSGKSTLLRLLPRLADPHAGRIAVSGTDLRDLDLARWRARLGYVPQDASLLSASIEENVRLGRDLPPGAIARAVETAGLGPDLARLPDGLATKVGERGATLSGGQRVRVALARALAGDPDVLVLDDVSSALDAATEAKVFDALARRDRDGRTTIVATHRPGTLERAARVVVLDEGRVVDSGRHRELLERCELYREVYARGQLAAESPG